jgi:CHASE2 domain-containing sensor protein
VCGTRLVASGETDEPYVVWRNVPGAILSTRSQTQSQYFTGMTLTAVSIGLFCVISLLLFGTAGLGVVALIAVVLAVAQYVYWVWGRAEAKKRP